MAYLLNSPFGGGATTAPDGSPLMTPDMIAQQRQYGYGELQQGTDGAPIRSWTQGAAKLAQALMGGLDVRRANQTEMGYRSQAMQGLIDAMNGGSGGSPSATPAAPLATPAPSDQGPENVGSSTPGMSAPPPAPAAPAAAVSAGPDTGKLLAAASNPYLSPGGQSIASAMLNYRLMPHPKSITYNPITGAAGTFEPITGQYEELPGASAGGGNGSYPPGFIFGGAKPYTDASTGESGLIDVNGVKAVIGKGAPNPTQAGAAGAVSLARQANDTLSQTETGETGAVASGLRAAGDTSILSPLAGLRSNDAKLNEQARQQFMQAVRGLAVQKNIDPDKAGFTYDAMFAKYGDTPDVLKQKAAFRQQVIDNLSLEAGPFAPKAPEKSGSADVLGQAREAIAKGAPRAAVIQRLKQNGIDPSGL